jgi:hypothetical protein
MINNNNYPLTEPLITVSSLENDAVVVPDLFLVVVAIVAPIDVVVLLGLLLLMELALIFLWLWGLIQVGNFLVMGMLIGVLMWVKLRIVGMVGVVRRKRMITECCFGVTNLEEVNFLFFFLLLNCVSSEFFYVFAQKV